MCVCACVRYLCMDGPTISCQKFAACNRMKCSSLYQEQDFEEKMGHEIVVIVFLKRLRKEVQLLSFSFLVFSLLDVLGNGPLSYLVPYR